MLIKIIFVCIIFKLVCGDNIEHRLVKRYNHVTSKCFDKHTKHNKPAYECSGLMRGLANIGGPQQRYAWSKKESNRRKNAFSVTFLRRDQRFSSFPHGYESGFIYYPHLNTPKGLFVYPVYCAFPMNGWTDFRGGRHGCGQYRKDTTGRSGYCNSQGITSLSTWTKHFENVTKGKDEDFNFGKYQCSFDMTTKEATNNFALVLETKKYLRYNSEKYSWWHNEIVIRAWNESHPKELPIEAFFYILGFDSGKEKAFMYQRDFLKLNGVKIPVVGIRLPRPDDSNLVVKLDESG